MGAFRYRLGRIGARDGRIEMKMLSWFVITAAGVFLLTFSAARAEDPMVERMRKGRAALESSCSKCHSIETPLAKDVSRAEWDALLIRMTAKGAVVSMEEKGLIIDYLAARHIFSSKCTVCHTKEKVYDREQTLAQWEKTVTDMAARQPGSVSAEEARAIIAYLAATLGSGE
jgi:mono/diheme cytochrome c family protein